MPLLLVENIQTLILENVLYIALRQDHILGIATRIALDAVISHSLV